MLSSAHRARIGAAAFTGAAALLLVGCASGPGGKAPAAAPAAPAEQPAAAAGSPAIGVSPGGVTTRIDEPAQSTEEQYGQACLTTRGWMDARGGDPHDLIEPYLQELQTSKESSPSTFKKTWAELSSAQQAAVIIAVRAAADGGC